MGIGQRFRTFIGPRPDLDQRAQDESEQHEHRLLLEAGQQPVQELGESQDAHDATEAENDEHRPVQVSDGLHDVVVLAHDHQDETARDARQDHRAHGDGAAQENEEPVVKTEETPVVEEATKEEN